MDIKKIGTNKLGILAIVGLSIILVIFIASIIIIPKRVNVRFEEPSCIKPYVENRFKTCSDMHVEIDRHHIIIPKDFNTDLASVPSWYQSIVSPFSYNIITPGILHDYLYSCRNGYTRKEIDAIFYHSLVTSGVSRYTAFKMWVGVTWFGGSHIHDDINCDTRHEHVEGST